jgi:two-component system, LuxR family, sensor kinase FixL
MSSRIFAGLVPAQNRATWRLALVYVAAYLLLDWASYIRPFQGLNITPWNPQPALAIALLIWSRKWIWLVWAALVLAELTVRGVPTNWLAVLTATIALSLIYAAVAQALAHRTDLSHPFATLEDLIWFAIIAIAGSLLSAILYVLAFFAIGSGPDGSIGAIVRYWVGDAVGLLVTLPIMLISMDRASRAGLLSTLRSGAWWITASVTCVCLWVVFGRGEQDYFKFFYLLLLPVVWASARFGVAGAVLASLVTQLGLIAGAQLALRHDLTVFELQVLMAASTMTALLVGVLVDERARAAADLRSSLRFTAAGQMAAALAHELSQPLTALSNYAQACRTLAAKSGSRGVDQRDQLSEIALSMAGEAQRAGNVVKRLRDFFKSGATSLQLAPPQDTIREAVKAQGQFAERLGVSITTDIDPDLPLVWVDPLQIAVLLRNLIANGIESASSIPSGKRVLVRARLEGGRLLVEVRDSGPGVDPHRLHNLFDALPSGKPGGLGVGLSICRAIVEAHGGKLWAEPGPGGHFFFLLPVEEQ